MTEEEEAKEQPAEEKNTASETVNEEVETGSETAVEDNSQDESLRKRFRLTNDEEVLMTRKPSFFAFIELYVLAVLITAIHIVIGQASNLTSEEASWFMKLIAGLIDTDIGEIVGVIVAMFILTWINRMLNTAGSGGWVTSYLILVGLSPIIIGIDVVIGWFSESGDGYVPFEYDATIAGIFWGGLMIGFTLFYQNSFYYAITNHRVIYTQHLFIPGDGRRILYDNIREIRTQRTALGSILGYVTIITDTGNQIEMVEEGMGVSVGTASEKDKGVFGKLFAFVTYQRTRKIERPDPKICFYQITKWRDTENLLNEMHQKHSQSGVLNDLKEKLQNLSE